MKSAPSGAFLFGTVIYQPYLETLINKKGHLAAALSQFNDVIIPLGPLVEQPPLSS